MAYIGSLKHPTAATIGEKFLLDIMADNVTFDCNWDGRKQKKSLQKTILFGHLIPNVLCGGSFYNRATYVREMRHEIRLAHQRVYQKTYDEKLRNGASNGS
jgi:hypothetical protein